MRVEGAAWGCCLASLLVQGVMLQGAARRVRTVPNSCCKGASEGCCCTQQGAAVRVARSGAGWWCRCRVLLQGAAVKVVCGFGFGMLVPLQDAAAGCCCRIFLRSRRRRSVARGEWLQRKELTKHKFWSCKCTMVQNWEVWGMIRAWFGVWFGNPSFLNSGSFVAWVSFSHRQRSTIATLSMAAMARPARRPWTGPEYEECEDLNAHLWFISAGLPASLLDVLLMYL